jgi:microcystin-dependent protein
MYFANATAPQGWFVCDGSAKSRTTYVDLFNAISTVYGTGDGATTFNLPDFRGQFLRSWSGATSTVAIFNGTINNAASTPATGTVLTVTTQPTGKLLIGQTLSGTNVTANTKIIAQVSGTAGGIGVYTVDQSSLASVTTITATVPDAGRAIGSNQDDLFKSHIHTGNLYYYDGISPINQFRGSYASDSRGTVPTNATGGFETRPINAALMVCIKY